MGTLKKPAKIDENAAAANEMMAAMAAVKAGKVPTEKAEPMVTISRAVELANNSGAPPQDCAEGAIAAAARTRLITDFELGTVVTLKSGGHLMTVVECSCSQSAWSTVGVMWSNKGKLHVEDIQRACLRLATETEIARARRDAEDIPF